VTRLYEDVLKETSELLKESESSSMVRYWKVGELVAEFCKGTDRSAYGAKTIQTLATDLQEHGVLSEYKDPTRFLYWSKSIHDTYKLPQLKDMCAVGYTVYHAKILLTLDVDSRKEVEKEMLTAGGKIMSGRQLQELIRTKFRQEAIDNANAALATIAEVVPPSRPALAVSESVAYSSAEDPDIPESEGGPSASELKTPEKSPRPVDKTPKPSNDKTPAESPLKVLNQLDKIIVKLLDNIPSAIIAVRTAGKTGFDSDKAAKNYATKLADAKAGLVSLQEPLTKLLEIIADEVGNG